MVSSSHQDDVRANVAQQYRCEDPLSPKLVGSVGERHAQTGRSESQRKQQLLSVRFREAAIARELNQVDSWYLK